jgi:prevent-host-death family protein
MYNDHSHQEATAMETTVSKSQFKARALQYFRQVEKSRRPLTVTDHGRPVVRVVPYQPGTEELLRTLRGSLVFYKNPTEPVGTDDWEALK